MARIYFIQIGLRKSGSPKLDLRIGLSRCGFPHEFNGSISLNQLFRIRWRREFRGPNPKLNQIILKIKITFGPDRTHELVQLECILIPWTEQPKPVTRTGWPEQINRADSTQTGSTEPTEMHESIHITQFGLI